MAPRDRLTATLALDEPVERVRLISPARAAMLAKIGIHRVRDLLNHFPRRYIDLSSVKTIENAVIGETCTIVGTVHDIKLKCPRPELQIVEIALRDTTGLMLVTIFRQPWLMGTIKRGRGLAVAGKTEFGYGFKRMTNPYLEEVDLEEGKDAGRVIPVHSSTDKISAAWMRRLVSNALDTVRGLYDPLPVELRLTYRLMSRGAAYAAVHFPHSIEEAEEARRRLTYEELLMLELFLMEEGRKRSIEGKPTAHLIGGKHVCALTRAVPFSLTSEQRAAKDRLLELMAKPEAANHLILGDVGTGKTVVAAFGLAAAVDSKGQALFMAPTEVLARQHGHSLGPLLEQAGVRSATLTGSTPPDERERIVRQFAAGELDVLIGTHILMGDEVVPKNLTLVVIDEQQRFGVNQRTRVLAKGSAPDALYLTATPIPRSLALALFGNLTLSYITQRPRNDAGRTTVVLPKQRRGEAFDGAKAALERGEQVYVVCPLVGKNAGERDAKSSRQRRHFDEAEDEGMPLVAIETELDFEHADTAAAISEAQMLRDTVFQGYEVDLLHGSLPAEEKWAVMERFRRGKSQVLVTTTVIEVGIDVPQATVMIIEDADRFGLSQLHQLRGRVGRGNRAGCAYLLSASKQEAALSRLQVMESTDDGFELATYDLSLRREGDLLGNRQHGASALKLVNVVRDGAIIEAAHADAEAIIESDPDLSREDHWALAREMRRLFSDETAPQGG